MLAKRTAKQIGSLRSKLNKLQGKLAKQLAKLSGAKGAAKVALAGKIAALKQRVQDIRARVVSLQKLIKAANKVRLGSGGGCFKFEHSALTCYCVLFEFCRLHTSQALKIARALVKLYQQLAAATTSQARLTLMSQVHGVQSALKQVQTNI